MTKEERMEALKELVTSIKPLDEIIAIARSIKRAKKALANVSIACSNCPDGDCKGCGYARQPTVKAGIGKVIALDNSEIVEAYSLCKDILHRRITQGIKRLWELVSTLEDSSEVIEGSLPREVNNDAKR